MTDHLPEKGLSSAEQAQRIEAILNEATLAEKVGMMSGTGFFALYRDSGKVWGAHAYRAGGGIERLGLEPFRFSDGPRGVARGQSTCFPCTMARGASFDVDLERRIGEAMGIELRAQGATLSGAVCINLLRHPAWGRAQETYGEDPHHLGAMGTALGLGIQAHNVAASVKHLALNSIENARFTVDVVVDERSLHEVYLPHFKACLDAGVATVMSAYNKMNGEHCGQNRHLLTDILRGEWGFRGFVHSDWVKGVYHPYGAAAGLDVENPEPLVFGDRLIAAVEAGHVEPQVIDDACRRILSVQFRFACAEGPLPAYPMDLVASPAHVALAREAAEKSAVLLENDGTLPFDPSCVRRVALLGRLARIENTGDRGSSLVRPPHVVTAFDALCARLGADCVLAADETDLDAAEAAARAADAVVIMAGYTADEEGEFIPGDFALGADGAPAAAGAVPGGPASGRGGDRASLGLPDPQLALLRVAARAGKPAVLVIVAGSAVLVEDARQHAGAILQTFYAGMEGGSALVRLLFGDANPSARLPFTVARDPAHYPVFDRNAERIVYGPLHGYTLFDARSLAPRYPFGHGLSYTRFGYRALTLWRQGDAIRASFAVTNLGQRAGAEIAQLYVAPPGIVPRPAKLLKGFRRIALEPGQTHIADIAVPLETLAYRCPHTHGWKLEAGRHRFLVGGSSADLPLAPTYAISG